jgi:hypothetical protein
MAASTLGRKTLEPESLHALLAGKFESAMRAVAAEMDMGGMHENRSSYVERVRAAVQEDLSRNGLLNLNRSRSSTSTRPASNSSTPRTASTPKVDGPDQGDRRSAASCATTSNRMR